MVLAVGSAGGNVLSVKPLINSSTNSISGQTLNRYPLLLLIIFGSPGYVISYFSCPSSPEVSTINCGHGYTGCLELSPEERLSADAPATCLSKIISFRYLLSLWSQALVWTSSIILKNASPLAKITANTFLMFGINPIPLSLLCNSLDNASVNSISICCRFSFNSLDNLSSLSTNRLFPSKT